MLDTARTEGGLRTAGSEARRMEPLLALATMALMLAALFAISLPAKGATYKWVDENGKIHYSDTLPPEQIDKASVQLNKQGVAVKRTDPAPTVEERKAQALELERQKQAAKEREIVERRDRALMQTYTSEDEIELSKTRALATIDAQMQSAQAYSTQLQKRKQELSARKQAAGDKGAPPAIERELEGIDSELGKQDGLIAIKKKEIEGITAKYETDKKRWRELKAMADASAAAAANAPQRPGTVVVKDKK